MLSSFFLFVLPTALALVSTSSTASRFELVSRAAPTCPLDSALSCSAASKQANVDTCCVNTAGAMLLTQFWKDSFTVHGLWPDFCDGKFPAFCDKKREYSNITKIMKASRDPQAASTLAEMNALFKSGGGYGTDESLQSHEWVKHGTCMSTLEPSCYGSAYIPQQEVVTYFVKTMSLFKSLPTYDWLAAAGISPSRSKTYTLKQLQAVSISNHGFPAVWNCRNGVLNEVWYGYVTRGNVESGKFIPTQALGKSTCPATGIKYLPKDNDNSPERPTRPPPSPTQRIPSPTTRPAPTGAPSPAETSGTVIINVSVSNGNGNFVNKGCLNELGRWSVGSKCAPFTYQLDNGTITLRSNGNSCGIVNNRFSCARNSPRYKFTMNRFNNLINKSTDSSKFFAPTTPSSSKSRNQISISTDEDSIALRLVPT